MGGGEPREGEDADQAGPAPAPRTSTAASKTERQRALFTGFTHRVAVFDNLGRAGLAGTV